MWEGMSEPVFTVMLREAYAAEKLGQMMKGAEKETWETLMIAKSCTEASSEIWWGHLRRINPRIETMRLPGGQLS